jgi:hypothetical protein
MLLPFSFCLVGWLGFVSSVVSGGKSMGAWRVLFLPFLICGVWQVVSSDSLGHAQQSSSGIVASGGDEKAPDEIHELVVNTTLEYRSDNGGYFFSPLEVSSLTGGKKYRLKIVAYNPTDQLIEFSKVVTDCSCAKFEATVDKILPHDAATFYMQIDAPMIGGESKVSTTAQFIAIDSRRTILRFQVTYGLNRVFSLPSNRFTIEVPKDLDVVNERIPIFLVEPLRLEDLELRVGETLRDFSIKLVEFENKSYISISVPNRTVVDGGILGEIAIKLRDSDRAWSLLLEVRRQRSIQVTPESLRFSAVNDDKTQYEATSLLRFKVPIEEKNPNREETTVAGKPSATLLPVVSVRVNDSPAEVVVKRLGASGLFRVTVRYAFDNDVVLKEEAEIKWFIEHNGEVTAILSTAFFSKLL